MNASIRVVDDDIAFAANPFLNASVMIPSSCAKCLSSAGNFAHHASAFLIWALLTDTIGVFVFFFCLIFIFALHFTRGGVPSVDKVLQKASPRRHARCRIGRPM